MGRWNITLVPGTTDTLTVAGDFDFASIKRFDIFEVEARGGGPAIWVQSSNSIQLKQLSIYSSGGVGIITNCCPFTSVEDVKVIPRPNTNRLVSTNAGGIAVNSTAQNNIIRNCKISGTQDDCISGNAPAIGYVSPLLTGEPTEVILEEPNEQLVTQGLVGENSKVYFVDPLTCGPVLDGSGHTIICTIAGTPKYTNTNGVKLLTVTMQSPVPELPAQAMMYARYSATRGNGLIIDSNNISSNTLARGIALSGQTGVAVTNNTLTRIQEAGILLGTDYAPNPKQPGSYSTNGPVSNILIRHNELHEVNIGISPIGMTMLAAIQILIINLNGNPATVEADRNIYILDNEIDDTPRTGIWIMNSGSGEVSNNKIQLWGYDPTIPAHSHIDPQFSVTPSDFKEPLVIQSSSVKIGINPH